MFVKLLTMATEGMFTFYNILYRQVDGVAMGSPLGPTLANLFMGHYEQNWQGQPYSPQINSRYVDDIFCSFENQDKALGFFDYINIQHQNLKFTMEESQEHSLPFLEVKIDLSENSFATSIYRKSTLTSLYLNFGSLCPKEWKSSLIWGTLHRAYTVCSSWELFHLEVVKVYQLFRSNGYPVAFLDRCC